jgi:sec-independent protein translocase protein TatA
MMPTLGAPELIIILVIIILIFGVGKLPEVGQALGKGIREFRGAADGAEDETPEAPAAPARPAAPAPAAVDGPRPAPAVDAPRQSVAVDAPRPAAAASAATTTSYTVSAGDTTETVAKSHGITVEELLAANGWTQKDRVLYEGDKILVPATKSA